MLLEFGTIVCICNHVKLPVTPWVFGFGPIYTFRASFHFEFINYFALQGFDLLVDWRQLPSLQKPHLDFLQIIMHLSECPGFLFPQYTFSLLTFSSFRFLSHTGSQVISPNQALFTSKFLLVLLTP